MPFWKKTAPSVLTNGTTNGDENGHAKKPKEKINFKARLEHKIYLATTSPEPVYDLSECGLKNVPSGVYINCKIHRKEALLLQDNELVALNGGGNFSDLGAYLQVLDLRNNLLEKLPEEIGDLKNLKVLYLHHNKLKKLPERLSEMKWLQSLDVSHNQLKDLPEHVLPNWKYLKTLNVSHNTKLKKLPKSLAQCHSLEVLQLPDDVQYPEMSIVKQGTEAIMRFLAKESNVEYISPSSYHPPEAETLSNGKGSNGFHDDDPYERIVRGSLKMLDKQKEEKMKDFARLEREREEAQAKEAALAASMASNKQKLLNDLAAEEAKREETVRKLQQMKDKEKEDLVSSLQSAECRTDSLIAQLMASNCNRASDPHHILEELQKERQEMEEFFTIKAGEADRLREQEIKRAMMSVMEEEMKREMLRREYEEGRKDVINHALSNSFDNDRAVEQVLQAKGKQQSELIGNLLEDEKYQRDAFAAQLLKQDCRHKELCCQVEQIQAELASLTMVEMTKKDLRVEFENDVMREKRATLTDMLMQLMTKQKERQEELASRMKEMEDKRQTETQNYWLIQYQKLLDSMPKALVDSQANMDEDLKLVLTSAQAEEFAPIFALRNINLKQLVYLKDKELYELGIHNAYLRQKIMKCAEDHWRSVYSGGEPGLEAAPSAPPIHKLNPDVNDQPGEDARAQPSAPPVETFLSSECVVCMEKKCDILFLPCGHVCCCWNCESGLSQCPLCQAAVQQRVKLQTS